ncbi:hypothetical protein CCHR01_11736 [Colletotrichum chrysophilum]|uniref:Uncharacterized protein n=1 Tax=Colletotrichum chrysophilum TaxID=1836956 RepID=A0AAD9AD74_9PEZI|nr:hypothetical protein CCHR01_11736 [Colletotrichum chrysophilum]
MTALNQSNQPHHFPRPLPTGCRSLFPRTILGGLV